MNNLTNLTKEELLELGCPEGAAESIAQRFAELEQLHSGTIAAMKLDYAADVALIAAGARNIRAVKSLLDLADITLDENGTSPKIAEQIAALKISDGYLFKEADTVDTADSAAAVPVIRGFAPSECADGISVNPSDMSYSQLSSYIENNPDFRLK